MTDSGMAPAGWHPDPADPTGSLRWWDGTRWTNHVEPAPYGPGGRSNGPGGWNNRPDSSSNGPGGGPHNAGGWSNGPGGWSGRPRGLGGRGWPRGRRGAYGPNQASVTAMVVTAIYVALAVTTRVYLIGILPVLMAYRAVRRREPLAALAVIAAVVALAVGFGLWRPL